MFARSLLFVGVDQFKQFRLVLVAFGKFHDLKIFGRDVLVALRFVRNKAVGTVFYSAVQVDEVAAAFFAERVQRTVTKQTVEVVQIVGFVARKILAILVTKKFETVFLLVFFHITPRWR